jgi:hydroxymethylpyrimidine/phosphomethylpyrimidine kinase
VKIPTCLTIAGSDSGGEAGVQADLKTFSHFNAFGTSAITATTAQNPQRIISLNPVSSKCLDDQLSAVLDYFHISHIKIGLLATSEQIKIVATKLDNVKHVIADPIMIATSGTQIMSDSDIAIYKKSLLPKVSILTPNWPEAEVLAERKIDSESDAINAMEKLFKLHNCKVYLKGGHSQKAGVDYFFDGIKTWRLSSKQLQIESSHGTGCRLSSAICASLAIGKNELESVTEAKNYVFTCLKNCSTLSDGKTVMNGSDHNFNNNKVEVTLLND